MKSYKKTVAILMIVQGALMLFGAGMLILTFNVFVRAFKRASGVDDGFNFDKSEPVIDLTGFFAGMLVFIIVLLVVIGIVYVMLGKKFLSGKPDRGIAITILVFCFMSMNIISILCIIFAIMYLVKLGEYEKNLATGGQVTVSASILACSQCGGQNQPGDKYCKMCGGRIS